MAALEAGSDIGSSIRNPAHYCGVFGLKPSWGVVPLQGHLPRDWLAEIDIAVTGPMARSAGDLSLAFEVLSGADRFLRPAWSVACPRDERDRLRKFKIAVKLGDSESPVDSAYLDVLAAFARRLSEAGLPSVVGPAGFVENLPVGYQAIAGFGRDRTALAFARAVERELGGFVPPPDLPDRAPA